jgi:hypothetical protein
MKMQRKLNTHRPHHSCREKIVTVATRPFENVAKFVHAEFFVLPVIYLG